MTNLANEIDAQEERSQIDAVDELDMANLRKVAKIVGISAQRDWSKEDFVRAIKDKQSNNGAALVFDNSLAPAPGYSRIHLHRDQTPGARNSPVHTAVNGWIFAVPRGIDVDVPTEIVGALAAAKSLVLVSSEDANGRTEYKDSMTQSYPFQVLASTPGKAKNPNDGRNAAYERRYAFFKKFERWPTAGELAEAMKHKIATLD